METLGAYAGVPVWNGLTDDWHPTQMLADILTMRDHARKPLTEVSYCYLGDGRNNTANSLLVTGALLGMDVRICAPAVAAAVRPGAGDRRQARGRVRAPGSLVTADVPAAVAGRGLPVHRRLAVHGRAGHAHWDERIDLLLPYQVNRRRDRGHRQPGGEVHALPAGPAQPGHRDRAAAVRHGAASSALEVTEEVFESPASIVFDQAENRLHTIKAVMVATAGDLP